jgi:hypothetical protein
MNKEIYIFLRNYCNLVPVKNILVTSNGDKSNILACMIKGLQENYNIPQNNSSLYYIESCKTKFEQVRNKYAFVDCVKPMNMFPINLDQLPIIENTIKRKDIYEYIKQAEISYITSNIILQDGIKKVLQEVQYFDLIFFNNSEITTSVEFELLKDKADAYLFSNETFYDCDKVFEYLKNSKNYIMLYSNSKYTMFIHKKLEYYFRDE